MWWCVEVYRGVALNVDCGTCPTQMLCNDNARMVSAFGKRVMAKNRYSNIIPCEWWPEVCNHHDTGCYGDKQIAVHLT